MPPRTRTAFHHALPRRAMTLGALALGLPARRGQAGESPPEAEEPSPALAGLVAALAAQRREHEATLGILAQPQAAGSGSWAALRQRQAEADAALTPLLATLRAHPSLAQDEALTSRLRMLHAAQEVLTGLRRRLEDFVAAPAGAAAPAPTLAEWRQARRLQAGAMEGLRALLLDRPRAADHTAPRPPPAGADRNAAASLPSAGRPEDPAHGGDDGVGTDWFRRRQPEGREDAPGPHGVAQGWAGWIAGGMLLSGGLGLWRAISRADGQAYSRSSRRAAVDLPGTIAAPPRLPPMPARVLNLSLGGAALRFEGARLRRGQRVVLEVEALGALQAQVVHHAEGLLRVRFLGPGQQQRLRLAWLTRPPERRRKPPHPAQPQE